MFFFFFLEFPEKPAVHLQYRNPKEPLTILPLVPQTNTAHVILPGVYSLDCNYGPDRNKPNKRKWLDRKTKEKDVDHNQTASVSKLIIQRGHKVDCPAKICIKETYCLDCKYDVSDV